MHNYVRQCSVVRKVSEQITLGHLRLSVNVSLLSCCFAPIHSPRGVILPVESSVELNNLECFPLELSVERLARFALRNFNNFWILCKLSKVFRTIYLSFSKIEGFALFVASWVIWTTLPSLLGVTPMTSGFLFNRNVLQIFNRPAVDGETPFLG